MVDDDAAIFRLLKNIFVREGFDVLIAEDGETGLSRALAEAPDLVILDLDLPKLDGIAVLERLKVERPGLQIIMLTGSNEARTAVKAIRLGAFDYVTKPFDPDEISVSVRRAMEARALVTEVEELRRQVRSGSGELDVQMGPSAKVRQIINQVKTVAATNFSVLVLGETGTGKELVASALHRLSERRSGPFVALDCGAIPEALLESELFGHEKGAFTGAGPPPSRALSSRRGRYPLSRRDRQPSPWTASKAAAGPRIADSCRLSGPATQNRSTFGSSLRPMMISRPGRRTAAFGPTSSFDSRSTQSRFPLFATGRTTSGTSRSDSCTKSASSCGARCKESRPMFRTCSWRIRGRVTFASFEM